MPRRLPRSLSFLFTLFAFSVFVVHAPPAGAKERPGAAPETGQGPDSVLQQLDRAPTQKAREAPRPPPSSEEALAASWKHWASLFSPRLQGVRADEGRQRHGDDPAGARPGAEAVREAGGAGREAALDADAVQGAGGQRRRQPRLVPGGLPLLHDVHPAAVRRGAAAPRVGRPRRRALSRRDRRVGGFHQRLPELDRRMPRARRRARAEPLLQRVDRGRPAPAAREAVGVRRPVRSRRARSPGERHAGVADEHERLDPAAVRRHLRRDRDPPRRAADRHQRSRRREGRRHARRDAGATDGEVPSQLRCRGPERDAALLVLPAGLGGRQPAHRQRLPDPGHHAARRIRATSW